MPSLYNQLLLQAWIFPISIFEFIFTLQVSVFSLAEIPPQKTPRTPGPFPKTAAPKKT